MKIYGFNEGDRSEYLAYFAFSTVAYCSPVPRQNDRFWIDFFAHLAQRDDNNLVASGRAVCVQVKSDTKPLLLETAEHRRCLFAPPIAMFLAVIDKTEHSMQVFTTIERIDAYWSGWNGRIWVIPGIEGEVEDPAEFQEGDHRLYLGKAIYNKGLSVLENADTRNEERLLLYNILESWAKWEQIHLASKEAGFPLFARWDNWETNSPPDLLSTEITHLYYPAVHHFEGYCRGVRVHIDVLRAIINDMAAAEAIQLVPDFLNWRDGAVTSIAAFLQATELPDPPHN